MTIRRSLVAAAVAVLACVYAGNAAAAGARVAAGGATAPASAAPASSRVAVARAELLAAVDRHHATTRSAKRQSGEFAGENTRLVGGATTKKAVSGGVGGTSLLRTIGGLLLVVAAIYGLAWVLRRVKRGRDEQASGRGLTSVATLPLGGNRALHLVRAGSDVILVGTSEQGVTPIQRYTQEEALANGVLDAGQRDAVLHDAASSFMPDGSPQPPIGSGWRELENQHAGTTSLIDALRRLTVRS
jgi:flagellar protein FliO/FliZ